MLKYTINGKTIFLVLNKNDKKKNKKIFYRL